MFHEPKSNAQAWLFSNTPNDSNDWGSLYPEHIAQDFKGTCIMCYVFEKILVLQNKKAVVELD